MRWFSLAATLLCAGCVGQPTAYYSAATLPRSLGSAGGITAPNVRILPDAPAPLPIQHLVSSLPPAHSHIQIMRRTNPSDNEICLMDEPKRWITVQRNKDNADLAVSTLAIPRFWNDGLPSLLEELRGRDVVSVENMTGGEYLCYSNVPGVCEADYNRPGVHTCHGVLVLRNGTRIPGTITADWPHATAWFRDDVSSRALLAS